MTMDLGRAFHPKMLVRLIEESTTSGYYNEDNDYIEGQKSRRMIMGVLLKGNRFSQFDEGIARHSTVGGERFTDYRTLYIRKSTFGSLSLDSHIIYGKMVYNVLQMDDELHFGFSAYILERDSRDNKEKADV